MRGLCLACVASLSFSFLFCNSTIAVAQAVSSQGLSSPGAQDKPAEKAQDEKKTLTVPVRIEQTEKGTSLFFAWQEKPTYSLSKEGKNRLLIRFGKKANLDVAQGADTTPPFQKIEILSSDRDSLQVAVTLADGVVFEDKATDAGFLLNVPVPPGGKKTSASLPVVSSQITHPHVITFTTMAAVGFSAFERNGSLWLVADDPDTKVVPVLSGEQKDSFAPFIRAECKGGCVSFHIPLPQNLHTYAEGGGLTWRVVLSPRPREEKKIFPATQDKTGNKVLFWLLSGLRKSVSVWDDSLGQTVNVITASKTGERVHGPQRFVEAKILDSLVGVAFVSLRDDLSTEILPDALVLSRKGGKPQALSSVESFQAQQIRTQLAKTGTPLSESQSVIPEEMKKEEADSRVFYHLSRWVMGGLPVLGKNEHVILAEISQTPPEKRPEDILTLAKLNLANDRGSEALGFLRLVRQQVPDIVNHQDYLALRGAVYAISGKYDLALPDLSDMRLSQYIDIPYWKAYTLAGLEDWQQAINILPETMDLVKEYPSSVRTPFLLTFAEIALRGGFIPRAAEILGFLEADIKKEIPPYQAAWNYLRGEEARQNGDVGKAISYWKPLYEKGNDNLYRAKAGLSLTKLELDEKKITTVQAIDRLEGLRFAWRGDGLETLTNFRLGQLYIENKNYLKGLTVLRHAVSLSVGTDLSRQAAAYMTQAYRDIFSGEHLKSVSALDAISIYEDFKELTPTGEEGDLFVEKLAERLVDADLLERSAALMDYQVTHRLQGEKKAEIAIRLAAIRLLDGRYDESFRALLTAQETLEKLEPAAARDGESSIEKRRQIKLLTASVLSKKKKATEAIALLDSMPPDSDVNRLRADISWASGKWADAADAFNDLIQAENIFPRRPLSPFQVDLILNRSIALNLAGDRVALANLRDRYYPQMEPTDKGRLFDIVTRPRKPDIIGTRESIEGMISEISLFKGFLDSYRKMMDNGKTPEGVKPSAGGGVKTKDKEIPKTGSVQAQSSTKPPPVPAVSPIPAEGQPALKADAAGTQSSLASETPVTPPAEQGKTQ